MKSLVFASKTLEKDEYSLYRQIFYIIYGSLPKPDLYVYLHVAPERLLNNIAIRGREYEKSITADYLKGIQESYFTFFRQNPENRYLVLDIKDLDFVRREEDYQKLKEAIFAGEIQQGLNLPKI
jgi:deoxyadenosine/deoxycytidine kinase